VLRRREVQRRRTIDGNAIYSRQETAAVAAADDKLDEPRPLTRDYGDKTQQQEAAEITD